MNDRSLVSRHPDASLARPDLKKLPLAEHNIDSGVAPDAQARQIDQNVIHKAKKRRIHKRVKPKPKTEKNPLIIDSE